MELAIPEDLQAYCERAFLLAEQLDDIYKEHERFKLRPIVAHITIHQALGLLLKATCIRIGEPFSPREKFDNLLPMVKRAIDLIKPSKISKRGVYPFIKELNNDRNKYMHSLYGIPPRNGWRDTLVESTRVAIELIKATNVPDLEDIIDTLERVKANIMESGEPI